MIAWVATGRIWEVDRPSRMAVLDRPSRPAVVDLPSRPAVVDRPSRTAVVARPSSDVPLSSGVLRDGCERASAAWCSCSDFDRLRHHHQSKARSKRPTNVTTSPRAMARRFALSSA